MDISILQISAAYCLDIILGDPHWFPHPVRGIGWLIKTLEKFLRRFINNEKLAGLLLALCVIGSIFWITTLLVETAHFLNPLFGGLIACFLLYTTFAVKSLGVESKKVYEALQKNDIISARKNLAMIVGRDTHNLNEKEIIRATVETVAENTVDGIVSPLCYSLIGGAPLAMTYKTINTLDSMVGYKNKKYRNFGFASAKIDDFANFLPARITTFLLPIAAYLCGKDGRAAWQIIKRDGHKHPSPNSGLAEAGMAGALGIRLGGLNFYQGKPSVKEYLGDNKKELELKNITDAIKIMYGISVLTVSVGLMIRFVLLSIWLYYSA